MVAHKELLLGLSCGFAFTAIVQMVLLYIRRINTLEGASKGPLLSGRRLNISAIVQGFDLCNCACNKSIFFRVWSILATLFLHSYTIWRSETWKDSCCWNIVNTWLSDRVLGENACITFSRTSRASESGPKYRNYLLRLGFYIHGCWFCLHRERKWENNLWCNLLCPRLVLKTYFSCTKSSNELLGIHRKR